MGVSWGRRSVIMAALVGLVTPVALVMTAGPAAAANVVVSDGGDTGAAGQLRQVVAAAAANDVITFTVPTVTLLLGDFDGRTSPATAYTPIMGAEVALPSATSPARLPLEPAFEHGVGALDGGVRVDGLVLEPGTMLYLAPGRTEVLLEAATGPTRAFLLGGEPFEEELVMWWNFVARTHEEIVAARDDWAAGRRFGPVTAYAGERLPAPPTPNTRLRPRPRAPRA